MVARDIAVDKRDYSAFFAGGLCTPSHLPGPKRSGCVSNQSNAPPAALGASGKFPAAFLIQNGRISMRSGIMDRAGPRSGIRKRM
jgi:hypothetical protein